MIFEFENCDFNCLKDYFNLKFEIWIRNFLIKFKNLLVDYNNGLFLFEYLIEYEINISTLKFLNLNFKQSFDLNLNFNSELLFWILKINTSTLKSIN